MQNRDNDHLRLILLFNLIFFFFFVVMFILVYVCPHFFPLWIFCGFSYRSAQTFSQNVAFLNDTNIDKSNNGTNLYLRRANTQHTKKDTEENVVDVKEVDREEKDDDDEKQTSNQFAPYSDLEWSSYLLYYGYGGQNTTTTTTTTTTRFIQGVAKELGDRMLKQFGHGFRSINFPCTEQSHRSVYWQKKSDVKDTWANRRKHVVETLTYLRSLLNTYNIEPWYVNCFLYCRSHCFVECYLVCIFGPLVLCSFI